MCIVTTYNNNFFRVVEIIYAHKSRNNNNENIQKILSYIAFCKLSQIESLLFPGSVRMKYSYKL